MAILKCKMCGGNIEFAQGANVGVCDSCGTRQTLPRLDDEKRVQLYDRANHFRRESEFDKAMGIYEMILADDREDPEAYWGIVLCKYGIEYVEDPRTLKRIPTVNRAQYISILEDKDYLSAIRYSDAYQREILEEEAQAVDKIQKGILEISSKEEPFDIFICYKETDPSGERTQDSVYAQEIYNALIKEGYKVFFSRITLENKLGQQYEPYIFAALHSAKVMLAVGTSRENFNAVWVKNEWSRFLALANEDSSKTLIPCYKDISPYDMPTEFTYLQSQDISKIGYMQDLLHGIEKLIGKNTEEKTASATSASNVQPLLERIILFLEDGDWQSADEYCEKVLDQDPRNAEAYLYKVLAEFKAKNIESLSGSGEVITNNRNFEKALRFADDYFRKTLMDIKERVNDNSSQKEEYDIQKKESLYKSALDRVNRGHSYDNLSSAVMLLKQITPYKDSEKLISAFERESKALSDKALAEFKKLHNL